MTREELNVVREIKKELRSARERADNLRGQRGNLMRELNGMPHLKSLYSRVEELAIKIIDVEEEIATLERKMLSAQDRLTEKIFTTVSDARLQQIFFMRYVQCFSFRAVAAEMNYSLSRVFKLHDDYFEKVNASKHAETPENA